MDSAKKERHRLALPLGYELGDRYQIREQLGFGSFGITYLAHDRVLSRNIVIKELLPTKLATRRDATRVEPNTPENADQWRRAQERFVQEARAIAAFEHPNVVEIFEAFQRNGTAYMVSRFEEGCILREWLNRLGRAPSEGELLGILEPLLSALQTVHSHRYLHRAIQPDNIYLGRGNRPILIDFGSARQEMVTRSEPITALVTEGYAPIEQYTLSRKQGPWTDLYALGAVMYYTIVGKAPPSAIERASAKGQDPCIRLAVAYRSQYSAGLLQSIDWALRLDAKERMQIAEDWRRMLPRSIPSRALGAPAGSSGGGRKSWWRRITTRDRRPRVQIEYPDSTPLEASTRALAPAAGSTPPQSVFDDDVQFTIYRPVLMAPEQWPHVAGLCLSRSRRSG